MGSIFCRACKYRGDEVKDFENPNLVKCPICRSEECGLVDEYLLKIEGGTLAAEHTFKNIMKHRHFVAGKSTLYFDMLKVESALAVLLENIKKEIEK